jgi:hypothetical protein
MVMATTYDDPNEIWLPSASAVGGRGGMYVDCGSSLFNAMAPVHDNDDNNNNAGGQQAAASSREEGASCPERAAAVPAFLPTLHTSRGQGEINSLPEGGRAAAPAFPPTLHTSRGRGRISYLPGGGGGGGASVTPQSAYLQGPGGDQVPPWMGRAAGQISYGASGRRRKE